MLRRTVPLKRTPFKPKPRRRDYGGPVPKELGGTAEKFRKLVRERDGNRCFWCGSTYDLTVAHLGKKVGMGGRRTSSVNQLENAVTLCWSPCHAEQEGSRTLTEAIRRKMTRVFGYSYETGENT